MLKKELITKKFLIKLIKERIRSIWALIIIMTFLVLSVAMFVRIYNIIGFEAGIIVYLTFSTIFFIATVFSIKDVIIDIVKFYSGKFYVVEVPLTSKSQKECYRPQRYSPDYYIEYSFYFENYGTYKIKSYEQFYFRSKENRMEPRIADIITEPDDKFYLVVRGGKNKKIIEIFHAKLFELDKDNFSLLYGKYYI